MELCQFETATRFSVVHFWWQKLYLICSTKDPLNKHSHKQTNKQTNKWPSVHGMPYLRDKREISCFHPQFVSVYPITISSTFFTSNNHIWDVTILAGIPLQGRQILLVRGHTSPNYGLTSPLSQRSIALATYLQGHSSFHELYCILCFVVHRYTTYLLTYLPTYWSPKILFFILMIVVTSIEMRSLVASEEAAVNADLQSPIHRSSPRYKKLKQPM